MKNTCFIVIAAILVMGLAGTTTFAQDEPADKKPAEKPVPAEEKKATDDKPTTEAKDDKPATDAAKPDAKDTKIKPKTVNDESITLVSVKGDVEVRPSAKAKWVPAKVGMKLGPDWEISTGIRGKATLVFKNNSVIAVRPLTEMTIGEFSKKDVGKIKTRIKMKYGAVQIQVKKGTALNDFQVASPTSTASVRGTKIQEMSYYRGIGGKLRMGDEGTVLYKVNPTIPVGPNQQTDDRLTSPIFYSKKKTWVPVNFAGFTKREVNSSFIHGTSGPGAWDNLRTDTASNSNSQGGDDRGCCFLENYTRGQ